MSNPVFFIPTRRRYWEKSKAGDPVPGMGTDRWIATEASRIKVLAERLFPGVTFELGEDPPATQTYQAGSVNDAIRAFIEARTALRFVRAPSA